jgi:hypothetical protein
MNQQNHNFQNEAFRDLFATITANMPSLTFFGIILTYGITAALSVYFLPIPLAISIPAALAVQFGRFAVVFTDFLNPVGPASKWPPIVATFATVVALVEYAYSVNDMQIESAWTDARYWSVYLFGSMLIVFGYILELNFINKGAQGYGMRMLKRNISMDVTPQSRPTVQRNAQPALVTAEKKRPEIMQELRERQEAQQAPQQAPAQQAEEPKTVVHTAFGDLEDEIKSMSPQERAVLLSVMIQKQRSTIRTNKQRIADKEKKGISDINTQVAAIQNAEAKINYYQSFL